jgi:hypothetical protein
MADNHLVANCLIFYNVSAIAQALHMLHREDIRLSAESLRPDLSVPGWTPESVRQIPAGSGGYRRLIIGCRFSSDSEAWRILCESFSHPSSVQPKAI